MEPIKQYRTILTALNANFGSFIVGTVVGWSSPTIPKLRDHTADSPLDVDITSADEGWISSTIAIGAFFSALVGGPLAGWIGRKWVLIFNLALVTVSYILLLFASALWMIYVARLLQGFGAGFVLTAAPAYVGEIATDKYRGPLGSTMTLMMTAGILYCFVIGPYVSYMTLQLCCLALPIGNLITIAFIPESPYFFATKGRKEDGIKSLQILRGQSAKAVEQEMTQIQAQVDEDMNNRGTLLDIFRSRGYTKALIICLGLMLFQQLSGTSAVTFNSQSIFSSAKSSLDPAIATIILGCVQVVSNFVTPFIVERVGRRIILGISAIGMCLSLVVLGAFFYIRAFGDASMILWLPIVALVCFNMMYAVGFGPIPYAILSEMFPSNIKGIATSVVTSIFWLLGFVVTRWFPELNDLGAYYSFWLFGSLCALALLFVLFVVIETKGMSLQQIQQKLHS